MDIGFCSRYPFSSEAKQHISASGTGLSQEVLDAGERRVLAALSKGIVPKMLGIGERAHTLEIASYAAARMIVASLKNRFLTNRYAIAEAKRCREHLNSESEKNIDAIAFELGLHFSSPQASGITLPVSEYLRFSPKSVDYKLVNRDLKAGAVSVTKAQRARLLEEAVRKHIELGMPQAAEFPQAVKESAERVRRQIPKQDIGQAKVEAGDYPPCIKKLLEDLALNENLPHTARWALCVYLLNAGVQPESIIKIFSSAPDFNIATTSYQVDYIRKKAYSVPSCATFDTYGICVANCGCGSPIYYKKPKAKKE